MGSSRCSSGPFHGSGHRGGIRLGLDAALRALVSVPDRIEAGRRVGRCLAWVVLSRLASRCFFGAVLGWNVASVRKGLSDGLLWVDPDELSGLTCKSV